MKIQRTIPPAAAPVYLKDLFHGLTGFFWSRDYIQRLKDEIREYFNVRHVFLVSSGKAALTMILNALKSLTPGKKHVLIPAYTCFSVPSAIVKAGLEVSLCDIALSTFDFDYSLLERSVNEDTLCVVPDHLFGIPSDMDRINSLCRDKGIFVIEDAAQAMGGSYNGRKLGTIGDAGFFSLGRGKNITCGSGGIIVTNSGMIADAIEKEFSDLENPRITETFREFLSVAVMGLFIHPSLYWFPAGLPFLKLGETVFYRDFPVKRLSGMKAGLLKGWQKRLEETNRIRRENAAYFCERLRSRLRLSNGSSIPCLRLPVMPDETETKERIFSRSERNGLGISRMYPTAINEIEEIKHQFDGMAFPSAGKAAERLLTIPTHQFLTERDKEEIVKSFCS